MAITNPTLYSNTVATGYDLRYDSLYSFDQIEQKYGKIVDLYGEGFGIREWLFLAGQEIAVKNHTLDLIERGALEGVGIKTGSAISTGSAGATISFTLDSSMYDSNNNCFLMVDDAIYIPPTYLTGTPDTPAKYQITARTGSAGSYTFTGTPFSTSAQIGTEIPAGTVLMATGGNFAPGSDGPGAKSRGVYERSFYTAIKKAGFAVEGGATSTERYSTKLANGNEGFFSQASIEAERMLDSYMNDECFLGEENANSSTLTMPNRSSNAQAVYGTIGLWNHLNAGGIKQTYVGTYEIADLADVRDGLLSQGVIDKFAIFGVGSELFRYIEDSGLDFLKEYSGGSDLMRTMNEAGIHFKAIERNSITFLIKEMQNLNTPNKTGLSAYNWKKAGFIIPQSKATVTTKGGDGLVLDNIFLGYKVGNGENRARVVKILKGVEGITGTNDAVDTYDDIRGQFLTEFLLGVLKRNQMVQVVPSVF